MDRISRRQFVRGAAATTAAATLGAPSVHAQKDRQILRFVAEADLKILDPVWTTAYITRNHGYLVYHTLFGTDENLQVKPANGRPNHSVSGRHEVHIHIAR
jgi:peptide/nickel transport system substrate-binding protein